MTEVTQTPLPAGQDEVFAFLGDPATHGLSEPVKRIDTHAAAVFLAGRDVYKVKRAVLFPFMDQSTLARRHAACEAEVRVNRDFTPEIYLGVVPITRTNGKLRFGGDGAIVEWAVHMKRFDESRTLDLVADRGEISPELIADIADLILASHRAARIGDGETATTALAGVVNETLTELVEAPDIFPAAPARALAASMRATFRDVRPLLLARGRAARVRRCHGDLHLRNIALLGERPILFDALEFDESIATTDVLYDLSFTLMDLWQRRLVGEANLLLNRYLWGSEDIGGELAGLAALPLFLSLRAAVLAKIDAIRFRDVARATTVKGEALRYFEIAGEFLAPSPPILVAIGGLSGTGKTTLAGRIAPAIGRAPGAVHLRSDIERKRRFGVPELQPLPEIAYRRDVTSEVFASLRTEAEAALGAGHCVIVDAVHRTPDERELIAGVAARCGARFVGLWLDAPLATLIARVEARRRDASDASTRVVLDQAAGAPTGTIAWTRLDASVPPDALARTALAVCTP